MRATHAATPSKESLFGICAAIGEDFGFNPDILRVALAASLLWNPAIVLGSYAFAGFVVLASRWLFPKSKDVARSGTAFDGRRDEPSGRALESTRVDEHVMLARAA